MKGIFTHDDMYHLILVISFRFSIFFNKILFIYAYLSVYKRMDPL